MKKNTLLGIDVTNETQDVILEYIVNSLQKKGEKYYIVTPNPEIITYAIKHPEFKSILNGAKIALSDGVGVLWAGKLLGKPFKERVTGVDLMVELCKRVAEKPITVGFLGGGAGVAEKTAECLTDRFPSLKVGFVGSEWPAWLGSNRQKDTRILRYKDIKKKTDKNAPNILVSQYPNIDLLFVAFGFPKQEEWIAENLVCLPIKVAMGVGGSFDYISGEVSRAPVWVQNFGLEWFYRLLIQPWRIKRQLALLEFMWLVLREKLKQKPSAINISH